MNKRELMFLVVLREVSAPVVAANFDEYLFQRTPLTVLRIVVDPVT